MSQVYNCQKILGIFGYRVGKGRNWSGRGTFREGGRRGRRPIVGEPYTDRDIEGIQKRHKPSVITVCDADVSPRE